jgi:hypothetical protein
MIETKKEKIAARRAPRAVFFRVITSAVTLGTDRASDLASARCLLVSVPVTVVAWTAYVPDDRR